MESHFTGRTALDRETAQVILPALTGRIPPVRNTKISVVIPALNEEGSVGRVVAAIPRTMLNGMGYDVQILVVDNGSTDATARIATEAGAMVVTEHRRGYGQAYRTGFARADGDIIVTADADLTYPVEDIASLVEILENEQLDFITTNRLAYIENGAMSRRHRLGNTVLSMTLRMLFGVNIRDSQSGMWVFRRRLLDTMVLRSDSMAFSEEIKIEACHRADIRWREVPIRYAARLGEAKLRDWQDGLANLAFLAMRRIKR